MTYNESRPIAKQAWRHFLRTAQKELSIGKYQAQVCLTDNHGKFVIVTGSNGHINRHNVFKSWSA